MEIEMMKVQLKEYGWRTDKEENNNYKNSNDQRKIYVENKKVIKRRRKQVKYYINRVYCRSCRRYFKNQAALREHCFTCKKFESSIRECKNQKILDNEPSTHSRKIEKFELRPLVSCKDCKLQFATTRELFKHRQYLDCKAPNSRDEESELSDNTDEEYEYDSLYTCAVCRGKFISRELLGMHRAREAHWGSSKPSAAIVIVKKELEDFTFQSCEENEYYCTGCNSGRIFYDLDDLLRHNRAAHSSEEIYCRYCCLRLSDIAEFNDHHRAYHDLLDYCCICTDSREYRSSGKIPPKPWCLNCCRKLGLPFKDCMSLLKETLYCDDCGKVMPSIGYVQYHHCAKQDLALSMLVCPLCMENFNSLRSLYRHVIRHNDMMSFRCNACNRLHETWKGLKDHKNKCHKNEDMKLPRIKCNVLRRHAEDTIKRFVKNGVKLLTD